MSAFGLAVVAVAVTVALLIIVVTSRRRRRETVEVVLPFETPLSLGAHLTARVSAPVPSGDSWSVEAALVCTEHVPDHAFGAAGAYHVEVARVVPCRHRLVSGGGEVLAEIAVVVPLDATPSMSLADHMVDWTLEVTLVAGNGRRTVTRHDVVVAPAVAVELLEGELIPGGDPR
jgi:hypothetical protein